MKAIVVHQYGGPEVLEFEQTRAFLKIQDGCDKFCSYCKIPHARGRSRSFHPDKIFEYAERLINKGYKEIVITGINISDYHYGDYSLLGITKKILTIPGSYRLRLSSLQPDEFEKGFLDLLYNPSFAAHFHLSLQSGSKAVLSRMERNYTPEYFLELCNEIRKVRSDTGITTDIIVGFPEETDSEFEETRYLVEAAEFSRVHLFSYSKRSHTKASKMREVNPDIKKKRLLELEETGFHVSKKFIEREVLGKPQRILSEGVEDGMSAGYTDNYIKIFSEKPLEYNQFHQIVPERLKISTSSIELISE